jgi:hypothetical protein
VRAHPAALVAPAAEAFGALTVALILNGALVHDLSQRLTVWIPAAFVIARALWAASEWPGSYFVVTSERILVLSGIGRRAVATTPLSDLTDLTLVRSFGGRLAGYGTFCYGPAGRERVLFSPVPYPEQLYLVICDILHPSADSGCRAGPDPDADPDSDRDEHGDPGSPDRDSNVSERTDIG